MKLLEWENLPSNMRTEQVRPYYDSLKKKKYKLVIKRVFDIVVSAFMIILLSPVMLMISIAISIDSKGGVFYRQKRVTQYGKVFRIFKFRTMVSDADKIGSHVTIDNDDRITSIGHKLRTNRLDEIPQLFNILSGEMTFVGTRPEAVRYVEKYKPEMMATLLLPAGVTSLASIEFKDEADLLDCSKDADQDYVDKVLPIKMAYNLREIIRFSLVNDVKIMLRTIIAVIGWW